MVQGMGIGVVLLTVQLLECSLGTIMDVDMTYGAS